MKLQDKVSIITGAASGIGLATAQRFAREGSKVVVGDTTRERVDEAVRAVQAEAGPSAAVMGVVLDVASRPSVDAMVREVVERWGRIDALVNNAGITQDARLAKMTEAQFDKVIAVNLKGVFNCTQACLDAMLAQGSGAIITASSVVGLYGNFGQTNYAATKAGVIGFTKTWARELGPKGIRAVAVCPGFIATPMVNAMPADVIAKMVAKVPMGRLGTPEEIAGVYAFLASDDAAYINGAVIEVSGGISL